MSNDFLKRLTQGINIKLPKATYNDRKEPQIKVKKRKHEETEDVPLTHSGSIKKKPLTKKKLDLIHKEKICHLRNKSHIHVKEEDNLPDPIESFDDLVTRYGISEQLRANITYTQPTPVQMQALPALLEKRELLALAPTGSGKTAAFVIPLLHHLEQKRQQQQLQAIILVPTRELAKQIYREVDKLCVGLEVFPHLLQSTEEVPPCDLLVTTPNRLVYLLNQTPCSLNMAKVKWLVVDECDKLFEAKHENSFRSQLATIYKACCGKNIRRALFSATYMAEVETWTQQYLNSPAVFYIGQKNFAVSTVKQEVLFCGQDSGKELAMEQLIAGGYTAPILVFVNTRARAYAVYRFVRTLEPKAKCFHSHLKEHERDAIMEQFADQKIPILVTTDIFSWGMDFDISLVVNYDVPHSLRTYVNRIGRTGRAGKPGQAVTYFNEVEFYPMTLIAKTIRASGAEVPDYLLEKKKVQALKLNYGRKKLGWDKQRKKNNQKKQMINKRK